MLDCTPVVKYCNTQRWNVLDAEAGIRFRWIPENEHVCEEVVVNGIIKVCICKAGSSSENVVQALWGVFGRRIWRE